MIRIIRADNYDPYYNLAVEESLLHSIEKSKDIVLYLWQNDNTIVVGRNQNVYTECDIKYAECCHTKIARRLTGGGAVYHDLGNINFTLITPRENYDIGKSIKFIAKAISRCGLHVEPSGRNDILAEGVKFSGNAFYSNKDVGLHHGTIMVDVDLEKMSKLLETSQSKIYRKGIKSVKSQVINLKSLKESLTCDEIKRGLEQELLYEYSNFGVVEYGLNDVEKKIADNLYLHYASKQWIFDLVKEFGLCFQKQFTWGFIKMMIELDGVKLRRISLVSDSLYPDIIDEIQNQINKGNEKVFDMLKDRYTDKDIEKIMIKDLDDLFSEVCTCVR